MDNTPTVGHVNLNDEDLTEPQNRSMTNLIQHKTSNDDVKSMSTLIVEKFYINIDGEIEENIAFGEDQETEFEVRYISSTLHPGNDFNKIDCETYARHDQFHKSW